MLPDLRFLVCGVLFCFLLFAATGAGVRLPDARTRVGEMPEIGRPMMQQSMAEAPVQAQLYMITVARRTGELDRLREQAEREAAAAPAKAAPGPDRDPPDPAATATAPGAAVVATDGPGSDSVAAEDAEAPVRASSVEIARHDRPQEAAAPRLAALAPPAAAGQSQEIQPEVSPAPISRPQDGQSAVEGVGQSGLPRFVNVPLPQPRPAFFGFSRRAHLLHRRRRAVLAVQRELLAQGAVVQSTSGQSAQGAVMQSLPGQAAQGAVVQGWQTQGAVAIPPAAESAKR